MNVDGSAKILTNVQTFQDCALHQCELRHVPGIEFNLKVVFCTRVRTSNEVKISIEAAWLACPEWKDETHFLPLPLFVPIEEFVLAYQCVVCGMSGRPEMLCDGKTRRILVNASEMFTKTFPQGARSLADINCRAATAGDTE